jgi:hypothetical protein
MTNLKMAASVGVLLTFARRTLIIEFEAFV